MKQFLLTLGFALITASAAFAQTSVGGYTKSNGTVVAPYSRTNSNTTNTDNYSTQGNSNPYTGTSETRARDYTPAANNYGSGRAVQAGSRGGQYHTNDSGRKVYVPKR